jgi:5-methylcytosine-specific restriction endonuclease McrA
MPRAPRKCNREGCETRGLTTYCPEHTPMNWGKGTGRTSTAAHKGWRAQVLKNAQGMCQIRGPKCTHRATEADHIIPLARGGHPTDPANGQGACVNCHKAKTQAEAAEGRRLAR